MKRRRSDVERVTLELAVARLRVALDSLCKRSAQEVKRVPGNVHRPLGTL